MSNDTLTTLRTILPEKLVIAALDLIDRGNGIQDYVFIAMPAYPYLVTHYVTPWGHSEYEVLGSTATYAVLLDVPVAPIPYSCACPAFIYSVLISRTHVMVCILSPSYSILDFIPLQCKHILAVLIARKMDLCIERPTNADDLAAIFLRRFEKEYDKTTMATT